MHGMYFYWDASISEFLFSGLSIDGVGSMLLLSLVLVVLSIIYEAIKVYQTRSKARTARENRRTTTCAASESATLLTSATAPSQRGAFSKKFLRISSQALVFTFQTTLGYLLMLAVMVYNGYVFVVVILGLGLGYFLFGHISMRINMENIRARTTRVICSPRCPKPTEPSNSCPTEATRGGYTNEITYNSSDSSLDETPISQLTTVETNDPSTHDSNIVYSCRL